MLTEHEDVKGRAAWLIRPDHFARSTQLFVTRGLPVYNLNFERRIFTDWDSAWDWLKEETESPFKDRDPLGPVSAENAFRSGDLPTD